MTPAEAVTRPDAWRVIGPTSTGGFRVGRVMDASGSMMWHRGIPRFGNRYNPGSIITFRKRDHAEARAGALNLADAEASR